MGEIVKVDEQYVNILWTTEHKKKKENKSSKNSEKNTYETFIYESVLYEHDIYSNEIYNEEYEVIGTWDPIENIVVWSDENYKEIHDTKKKDTEAISDNKETSSSEEDEEEEVEEEKQKSLRIYNRGQLSNYTKSELEKIITGIGKTPRELSNDFSKNQLMNKIITCQSGGLSTNNDFSSYKRGWGFSF